jgi:hypothetical protein
MDITPERFPISVNGGMHDRLADSARDPLHARALVLDDGATRVAIVVCDSCMIPREIMDETKARASESTGIPTTHMLISATHTHEAPTVTGVFQSDPDRDYQAFLTDRIAAAIVKANGNLAPAAIGWGVGREPANLFNRRWKMEPGTVPPNPFGGTSDQVLMNPGYQRKGMIEPAGPIDPDVSFVSCQAPDGRPIAFLANYSLHYIGDATPLSADYFGAFAVRIAQLLEVGQGDPQFVGILSNGTSGDVNNVNYAGSAPGPREEFSQSRKVADSVAQAAMAALPHVEHHASLTLAAAEEEIELAVRKPSADEVARARETIAGAKEGKLSTLAEVYARETVLLADYPSTVRLKLQALRIGDAGICAIPCEVFTEIGLELKAKSPLSPTFTIELANGYNGYLPTPAQHELGGYETWRARSSYLEESASTRIVETLKVLLARVASTSHP